MVGALRISDAASLAMHAMAFMATHRDQEPIVVSQIASAIRVSETHLGKVLQRLARHGFLTSRRGPGGGYGLSRTFESLTLLDVYEAIDGPLASTGCLLGRPVCSASGEGCILGDLIENVNEKVRQTLASTRLADIVFDPVSLGTRASVLDFENGAAR